MPDKPVCVLDANVVVSAVLLSRDPKDNKYLELALEARATCIISGDKDLLVLHPYHGIKIRSPKQFIEDE